MKKSGFMGSIFLSAILLILSGCGKTVLDHEGTEDCILLYADKIKTDDVVIFNTHNGAVVDVLQTSGNKRAEEVSNRLIVCGDKGSTIFITTYESRKMSRLNCSYGVNSWTDNESFEEVFCTECKGNIYHEKYYCDYEERKIFDITLLDMKTGMIYPVTDAMQDYFIRDYYIQVAVDSESVNILLVYVPVE